MIDSAFVLSRGVPGSGEVHLWIARLGCLPSSCFSILSKEERKKCASFWLAPDGDRHALGRLVTRLALGGMLGVRPDRVRLRSDGRGKPIVHPGMNSQDLRFNISHSGDVVLLAVAAGRSVGVDVELIRADMEYQSVADQFLSPRERADLSGVPEEARREAFFRCWCRKEALIKALGLGLGHPLDRFDVFTTPGESAVQLQTRPDPAEARRWSIRDVEIGEGYAAALALEGVQSGLKSWRVLSDRCVRHTGTADASVSAARPFMPT